MSVYGFCTVCGTPIDRDCTWCMCFCDDEECFEHCANCCDCSPEALAALAVGFRKLAKGERGAA